MTSCDSYTVDIDTLEIRVDPNVEGCLRQINDLMAHVESKLNYFEEELNRQRVMLENLSTDTFNKREQFHKIIGATGTHTLNLDVITKCPSAIEARAATSSDIIGAGITFHFRRSIWDIANFIGHPILGTGLSCFVFFLALASVLMQGMMCVVAAEDFARSVYTEDFLEGLRVWRLSVGHEARLMDQRFQTSLVSRVCDDVPWLEMSERNGQLAKEIHQYLPELSGSFIPAPVFCIGCIILLFFSVAVEVGYALDSVSALRHVNQSGSKFRTHLVANGNHMQIISWGDYRMTWTLFLTVARLAVCGVILVCGTRFLLATHSKQFLLLNSVKLMLIMRVNELIMGLAPESCRNLIDTLSPIHVKHNVCRSFSASVVQILILVGWLSVAWWWLEEEMALLRRAYDALCGGDQNWVYGIMANGQAMWAKSSPNPQAISTSSISSHNDKLATEGFPEFDDGYVIFSEFGGVYGMDDLLRLRLAEFTAMYNVNCVDLVHIPDIQDAGIGVELEFLRELMGGKVESCSDVAVACTLDSKLGIRVRQLCPLTCGCALPNSTLALSKPSAGCPLTCTQQSSYIDVLQEAPCSERAPDELRNSSDWRDFALQVHGFRWSSHHTKIFHHLHDSMLLQGCGVIDDSAFLSLCTAEDSAAMPIKSFQLLCPISCRCKTSWVHGCPLSCQNGAP